MLRGLSLVLISMLWIGGCTPTLPTGITALEPAPTHMSAAPRISLLVLTHRGDTLHSATVALLPWAPGDDDRKPIFIKHVESRAELIVVDSLPVGHYRLSVYSTARMGAYGVAPAEISLTPTSDLRFRVVTRWGKVVVTTVPN